MSDRKVGVWFLGAFGGVATTTIVGLVALTPQMGLAVPAAAIGILLIFREWAAHRLTARATP